MGKQKNRKKRHRTQLRERKRALARRYLAVKSGRVAVEDKGREMERLARQLARRGWAPPEPEAGATETEGEETA